MIGAAPKKRQGSVGDEAGPSRPDPGRPDEAEATATSTTARQPSESRISRIAKRAHEIYEARGGEHGKAIEDWLQAEREIDEEMEQRRGTEG